MGLEALGTRDLSCRHLVGNLLQVPAAVAVVVGQFGQALLDGPDPFLRAQRFEGPAEGLGFDGTVEETVQYMRDKLDLLMPGGGYAMSPTHQLQDNSRTENVIAMYETAREYGRYHP